MPARYRTSFYSRDRAAVSAILFTESEPDRAAAEVRQKAVIVFQVLLRFFLI